MLFRSVVARVGHPVGVDDAAVGAGVAPQPGAHAGAVEDVVAEHEGGRLVPDEVGPEHEGLGQAVGDLLDGVGQVDAEPGAVAQQAVEALGVVRGGVFHDLNSIKI